MNFREFEAVDPFGHKIHVLLKWLQTAISIRHSDSVDVKFVLTDESAAAIEKTVALPHPYLLRVSHDSGRVMDDPWCARIAAMHMKRLIETGEDMEKDLATVPQGDIRDYAERIAQEERAEVPA